MLKDAEDPFDAREIAELTGQNYRTIRMVLSRMHEAREIIRPYRGKYTTPNHASIATKNAETNDETTETIGTSATSATTATNPASDLAPPGD